MLQISDFFFTEVKVAKSSDIAVVELSFRKGRVQTVSVNMRALCTRIFRPGHMQRSFLVQKGTSILDHLVLFSQMHSFTGTIVIFLC